MNQDNATGGLRGLRAIQSSELIDTVSREYGFHEVDHIIDLGGSSNLNLLVKARGNSYVARVYRPYVTKNRLNDIQHVRRQLAAGGVPCAENLLTQDNKPWIQCEGRLIEVEHFIDHDGCMDSWERLGKALPLLGKIHTLLESITISQEGMHPAFANSLDPQAMLERTHSGTQRIRSWPPSPARAQLADMADELAERLVTVGKGYFPKIPKQLVHGDFWDSNVRFHKSEIAFIADFDFMGERFRINDLALTLYFTSMEYALSPLSDVDIRRLKRLVDAYDSGLTHPLSSVERAALPIMIAAQPLWSIGGWVAQLDNETTAQEHAAGTVSAVKSALELMQNLERWQNELA